MSPAMTAEIVDFERKMLTAGAVFFSVFIAGYAVSTQPPFDMLGYLIGRDFLNTWMGAKLALAGDVSPYMDFSRYNEAIRALLGGAFPEHNWSYPPQLLLFTRPFGLLPYGWALVLWWCLGLALYLTVAARDAHDWQSLLFLTVSPAVAMNLFTGQNGFISAALIIGGLSQLEKRPWLAGLLIGLLAFKPQLGLLLPLMLLAGRHWRALFAASATTLALVGASMLIDGVAAWKAYVEIALPVQNQVMTGGSGIFPWMMPTPFMNARIAGFDGTTAMWVQAPVTLMMAALVVWTYARQRDPLLSQAVLLTAMMLASPYAFNYDMVVFGWILLRLKARTGNSLRDHKLMAAIWVLPVTCLAMGACGIPGSSLFLIAFLARLLQALTQSVDIEAPPLVPAIAEGGVVSVTRSSQTSLQSA